MLLFQSRDILQMTSDDFFTFGQLIIDNTQLPRFMQFFWALAFWNCLVLLLEIFACCFGSIVLLYARRNFLISILRPMLWNDHLRVLWLRCWASGFVAKDGRGVQVDQDTNAVLWHTADVIGGMTVDGLVELQAVMTVWTAEVEQCKQKSVTSVNKTHSSHAD